MWQQCNRARRLVFILHHIRNSAEVNIAKVREYGVSIISKYTQQTKQSFTSFSRTGHKRWIYTSEKAQQRSISETEKINFNDRLF